MAAGPATPGTFFCFVAAILLIFVSVSSPTWERVSFLDVTSGSETTHFGVFGHTGTSPSIGYTFDTDYFKFDSTQVILNLTKTLILHPIAAGLSVIAFLCGLCGMGYHRSGTVLMTLLGGLAAIITLVAWIIDMSLFGIARNQFRSHGFQANYGNANWLTLGALAALMIGFIASTVGIFGSYKRKKRYNY